VFKVADPPAVHGFKQPRQPVQDHKARPSPVARAPSVTAAWHAYRLTYFATSGWVSNYGGGDATAAATGSSFSERWQRKEIPKRSLCTGKHGAACHNLRWQLRSCSCVCLAQDHDVATVAEVLTVQAAQPLVSSTAPGSYRLEIEAQSAERAQQHLPQA
jgi:hypothetical protein